jgi:hypothetical protein
MLKFVFENTADAMSFELLRCRESVIQYIEDRTLKPVTSNNMYNHLTPQLME